jgi:hypothetical protein
MASFLDWREDGVERRGTATIIVRTRKACEVLEVGMKLEGNLLVIKAHGPEKKTNSAVGIDRYLTQKVLRPQKAETLSRKIKHGVTLAALENNLVSNKMLTDAKITR